MLVIVKTMATSKAYSKACSIALTSLHKEVFQKGDAYVRVNNKYVQNAFHSTLRPLQLNAHDMRPAFELALAAIDNSFYTALSKFDIVLYLSYSTLSKASKLYQYSYNRNVLHNCTLILLMHIGI